MKMSMSFAPVKENDQVYPLATSVPMLCMQNGHTEKSACMSL